MSILPATPNPRASSDGLDHQVSLQAVVDALPTMVCVVGPDRRYRMCNRAYAARHALTSADVIGRHVSEVLGEKTWRAVQPHVDAALQSKMSAVCLSR